MTNIDIKAILVNNPLLREITLFCIERIARIYSQVQSLASTALQKDSSEIKTTYLINCLKEVLKALLCAVELFTYAMNNNERTKEINNIRHLLAALIKLREELSILPKKEEPIELYRFLRIFNRYGIADSDDNEIKFVLYTAHDSELSTYSTFENTPLEEYETKVLMAALERIYSKTPDNIPQDGGFSYHIRIRREVTETPLFWPILAHEIGHQVMQLPIFGGKLIQNALSSYLGHGEEDKYHPDFKKLLILIDQNNSGKRPIDSNGKELDDNKILRSWLTECWCDIYAYFATGPAFIFAQRNAFFIEHVSNGDDIGSYFYPPAYLRLLILQEIATIDQVQFSTPTEVSIDTLDSALSEELLHHNPDIQDSIHNVAQWLIDFFNDHFKMHNQDTATLHKHIKKLREGSIIFSIPLLQKLVDRINQGYPIPSVTVGLDTFDERETTVHEIMMAAWISHDNSQAREVINILSENFEKLTKCDIHKQWNFFEDDLVPVFERFNQAVLRSLQISEWVELLKPTEEETRIKGQILKSDVRCVECFNCDTSLLVDHEIKELLKTEQLKVIPLINLDAQLGSTSLDIRLGPTFQTYQPNQSGVVDFTDDASVRNVHANSTIVDLDYKKGIVLAPGQFVLAHTMEYIGLPENVAAQIEGRSSFARLGIQVHMTANLIDPGFHGSITFEIFNAGPNPIRLFPGYRIGQLRFFKCKKPDKPYNKKQNAKYKGLLVYSNSKLTNDYEIERISKVRQ